jgi:hypothetical protein
MPHYLVVEPHADDAFLSLGGHIERWIKSGVQVTIATIYSGTRKRGTDALAYANAVGAEWMGLGIAEGKTRLEDPDALAKACRDLRVSIKMLGCFDQTILPLGISHDEHRAVRTNLEDESSWFYFDQPYSVVSTNLEEVMMRARGRVIESYMKPHLRKYRHIPLFKDQAKFFHFNPAETLNKTFEMIIKENRRD